MRTHNISEQIYNHAVRLISPFASQPGSTWAAVPTGPFTHQAWPIASAQFRDWLAHSFHAEHGVFPGHHSMRHALRMIHARARFDPSKPSRKSSPASPTSAIPSAPPPSPSTSPIPIAKPSKSPPPAGKSRPPKAAASAPVPGSLPSPARPSRLPDFPTPWLPSSSVLPHPPPPRHLALLRPPPLRPLPDPDPDRPARQRQIHHRPNSPLFNRPRHHTALEAAQLRIRALLPRPPQSHPRLRSRPLAHPASIGRSRPTRLRFRLRAFTAITPSTILSPSPSNAHNPDSPLRRSHRPPLEPQPDHRESRDDRETRRHRTRPPPIPPGNLPRPRLRHASDPGHSARRRSARSRTSLKRPYPRLSRLADPHQWTTAPPPPSDSPLKKSTPPSPDPAGPCPYRPACRSR